MIISVEVPRPSAAEQLLAEHGHAWEIWREVLPGGHHGDWVARRWPTTGDAPGAVEELRAPTVPLLAAKLIETGQP